MRTFSLARDAACAARAAEQYGLVTISQMKEVGLTYSSINRRVHAGLLMPMLPGVFRIASVPRSWHQRAMATHLWAGCNSLIAGHAAAGLHRIDGFALPSVIGVWTPKSLKAPNRLVKVHRKATIERADRTSVAGIPVLSALRALVDVAGAESDQRLEIALEDVLRRRLVAGAQDVSDRVARLPLNQPGRAVLLRLLSLHGAAAPAESALEVLVIRMLRKEGFPPPIRQKMIDDEGNFVGRVDLVYPDRRLVLEVDSFRHHGGRTAFERDRKRNNALGSLGWLVLHVTHAMLQQDRQDFLRAFRRAFFRAL